MIRTALTALALFRLLALPPLCAAAERPAPQVVPPWFLEEVEAMTRDGGLWIADNAAYRSAEEPADAYAIHWQAGIGGTSAVGRLYGLRDGEETATFWELRQYWDPLDGQVRVQQLGHGGAYGEGTLIRIGTDQTLLDQEFVWADGSRTRQGHRTRLVGPDEQLSESFDITAGSWEARRSYTWRRRPGPG